MALHAGLQRLAFPLRPLFVYRKMDSGFVSCYTVIMYYADSETYLVD